MSNPPPPHADENTPSAASVKSALTGESPSRRDAPEPVRETLPGVPVSPAGAAVTVAAPVAAAIVPGAASGDSGEVGAGGVDDPATTATAANTNTTNNKVRASNVAGHQSQHLHVPMALPKPASDTQPGQPTAAATVAAAPPVRTNSPPRTAHQQQTCPDIANNADTTLSPNNKKPRPPAFTHRQSGSSLLTQALATARGILPSQQQQPLTSPTRTQPLGDSKQLEDIPYRPVSSTATSSGSSHDDIAFDHYDVSIREGNGGSLTPRTSPRTVAMAAPACAATTTTTTAANISLPEATLLPPPPYDAARTDSNDNALKGHRSFLGGGLTRGKSLERLDKEIRALHEQGSGQGRFHSSGPSSSAKDTMAPGSKACGNGSMPLVRSETNLEEGWNQARPVRPEHRFSMGAEKIWSIGSGEAGENEGSQVEKSVTEAMVKADHIARSRKASHTLGFFKEANPQDTTKRRDPKRSTRDKASVPLEQPEEAGKDTANDDVDRSSASRSGGTGAGTDNGASESAPPVRQPSTQMLPTPKISRLPSGFSEEGSLSTDENGVVAQPVDSSGGLSTAEPRLSDVGPATAGLEGEVDVAVGEESETRRPSAESTEIGESGEDADDSGEEKISSAFFVPHHVPEEPTDQELEASGSGPSCKSRSQSRSQDDNPWLVKADEPEPEPEAGQGRPPCLTEIASPELLGRATTSLREETSTTPRIGDDSAIVDEPESVVQLQQLQPSAEVSRPGSVFYEDQLHEHHIAPKQPLSAIELIPYRHQVGGHTTLWRFSKRAVCKQLNNRENEFYETVERLHRDLLSFLPRYIGVLNVTFQKQPRRKSTVKRDDSAAGKKYLADTVAKTLPSPPEEPREPAEKKAAASSGSANGHHVNRDGREQPRVISQSISASLTQIPTVAFDDNRHIIPRNLLQPDMACFAPSTRRRSASGVPPGLMNGNGQPKSWTRNRPVFDDRANSWGATTVNKKLRNEVFNDAFLKQPVAVEKHRRPHQRSIPRPAAQHMLKSANSDSRLLGERILPSTLPQDEPSATTAPKPILRPARAKNQLEPDVKDISGTSAPEPEIPAEALGSNKRKRRFSGSGLRRKPPAVSEPRGDLKYFEEADQVGYKDREIMSSFGTPSQTTTPDALDLSGACPRFPEPMSPSTAPLQPQETTPVKVPRPINPKEAQTHRDRRVEYFLLLEDLTAGMKKPCVMDLKMGTRQYGVEASAKKQASQRGKCAKTTSRELGVRVCGLQVWDARSQTYVFRDKYAGRDLQAGREFKEALARFLFNGVDYYGMLRHIHTVLQKLEKLEAIVRNLRGYRFYAASLLMYYDGDTSPEPSDYDTAIDDSTTDAATDTEEASALRRKKRNKREIDFKIADFANSITATSDIRGKRCPPQHPGEPDRGFLRGLRSLRKYFLQIQKEVREHLGIEPHGRTAAPEDIADEEDEGLVSE